ncbi:MAG: DUF4129 domain-containing protein [bacterium]
MLIQAAQRVWPPATVHDTVAAVARQLVYRRGLGNSLGERILNWIGQAIARLFRTFGGTGIPRAIGFAVVTLLVLLVVARLVIAARARDDGVGAIRRRGRGERPDDPFSTAERLAGEGKLEEAAHALYRGVLLALARTERLRLDPSKTSGDYARELRLRGSSVHQPFRAFARRFDVAVYGHGPIDAALVADLWTLAAPFLPRARAA